MACLNFDRMVKGRGSWRSVIHRGVSVERNQVLIPAHKVKVTIQVTPRALIWMWPASSKISSLTLVVSYHIPFFSHMTFITFTHILHTPLISKLSLQSTHLDMASKYHSYQFQPLGIYTSAARMQPKRKRVETEF